METGLLARLLGAQRTVTPLAPISAAGLTLPQLELGQSVRAQITARLADGSFHVTIKDVPLKVALPPETKAGDIVTLRLVAREPQLQFAFESSGESANLRLSGAGRLIGEILREPLESQSQQARPVAPRPTADAAELREPLARAIQRSGLFYESHQARWIEGNYPLALLAEEPQAGIARRRDAARDRVAVAYTSGVQDPLDPNPETSANRAQTSPLPPSPRNAANPDSGAPHAHFPADVRDTIVSRTVAMEPHVDAAPVRRERLLETGEFAPAPGAGTSGPARRDEETQPAIARELVPIVRQQLETIETRQIVWQGELWPGQTMRWQIADREPDPQRQDCDREWLTRFALRLATLGGINADVAVGARGIRVRISTEAGETADALRAATPELADALQRAGLTVTLLEVHHHAR